MKLYFLRHANALEGADDAARPLSPQGREEARAVAEFLRRARVQFEVAYTSPLVRARQTTEIVLGLCGRGTSASPQVTEALLNETSAAEFFRWLARLPSADPVLLVGHAPTLARRVRHLLGVTDPEGLKLPTAGLACVETEDRQRGSLRLFLSPSSLSAA